MKIYLTLGKGKGKTLLSAFDSALHDAGVDNYNLLALSSVIPPNAEIVFTKYPGSKEDWGNRLYVVKAEKRSDEKGRYIGAAIGWHQLDDGRGLFVEHEEIAETKFAVETKLKENISKSLSDLCITRKINVDQNKFKMKINVMRVSEIPSCVIVIAVYMAQKWY